MSRTLITVLFGKPRSFKARGGAEETPAEGMKGRALIVMDRVQQKLTGTDFQGQDGLSVEEQVDLLIKQATLSDNLCQSYVGWCPFW
jgi:FKBP12-rapamycin complex-associated protein